MYAVIRSGGKQYRVSPGDILRVERLKGKVGDQITFEKVLLVGTEGEAREAEPVVPGTSVTGTIVDQGRGDKVLVFKFKRRKMYRRKYGHRQFHTAVRIDEIKPGASSGKKSRSRRAADEEPPQDVAPEGEKASKSEE